MKRYKRLLKEENALSQLKDVSLVDKLIEFFKSNPYPQDHNGIHKFAESLDIEADILEVYIYAIVSCFINGGNFNKSGKKEEDFDPKEIEMGKIVEGEHLDMKTDNPVVKHIADYMRARISKDHLTDNPAYYSQAKAGTLQIEELVKK